MKAIFLTMIAAVSLSAPAFARDGTHLSCSGFMSETQADPDNYGIVVDLQERRASDGESREETLSMIWAGDLYQGTRLNKSDQMGSRSHIALVSKNKKKALFFKGGYKLTGSVAKGENLKLKLWGSLNETPLANEATKVAIASSLNCVDLSN